MVRYRAMKLQYKSSEIINQLVAEAFISAVMHRQDNIWWPHVTEAATMTSSPQFLQPSLVASPSAANDVLLISFASYVRHLQPRLHQVRVATLSSRCVNDLRYGGEVTSRPSITMAGMRGLSWSTQTAPWDSALWGVARGLRSSCGVSR